MWFPLTSLTTFRLIDAGLTSSIAMIMSSLSGILLVLLMLQQMLPALVALLNPSFRFTSSYSMLTSGPLMWTMSIASLGLSIAILVLTLMPTGKLRNRNH